MKTINLRTGLAFLLVLSLVGCTDLTVENQNSPNRDQVLAAPADVENLVGGSFIDFWVGCCWAYAQLPMTTMADEWSFSWGNYDGRVLSSEPRVAYNNSPSYTYRLSAKQPWDNNYLAISNASDGLAILTVDEAPFVTEGIDIPRMRAFAKFVQGMAHGYVALRYDQGFTVDETSDLAMLDLKPYTEVMDFAIQKLEESIAIANSSTFTISAADDWIFGIDVTNQDLVKIAHAYIARFIAQLPRDPAERAAVNWSLVMSHADQGITVDFAPIGDDSADIEWDPTKDWGQEGATWSRADYRTIGPADESGGYQNWLSLPVEDRVPFDMETSDRRIMAAPGVTQVVGPDDTRSGIFTEGETIGYPQVDGTDFQYWKTGPFRTSRGTYHNSSHTHKRYDDYQKNGANGEMVQFKVSELDLLRAEGLLWTGGSLAEVAELINRTRVTRGELGPAAAGDGAGSVNDEGFHVSPTLWGKLKYEKRIELYLAGSAVAYNDDRGWGDLVSGTMLHFAIPGQELEVLQLANYTFGGSGPGSAPKRWGTGTIRRDHAQRGRESFRVK